MDTSHQQAKMVGSADLAISLRIMLIPRVRKTRSAFVLVSSSNAGSLYAPTRVNKYTHLTGVLLDQERGGN